MKPNDRQVLAAIQEGVYQAFLKSLSAMNDNPVPMFREDLLEAIKAAVVEAIFDADLEMP